MLFSRHNKNMHPTTSKITATDVTACIAGVRFSSPITKPITVPMTILTMTIFSTLR